MGWGFICDAGLGSMLGIWAGGSFHRGLVVRRAALESLLHGNESFATHFTHDEPELLKQLSTGQHPKIFWLGKFFLATTFSTSLAQPYHLDPSLNVRRRGTALSPAPR